MQSVIACRIGRKAQITLPREVRAALDVAAGDVLSWHIDGERVALRRATEDPFAAFDEWSADADRAAYAGL